MSIPDLLSIKVDTIFGNQSKNFSSLGHGKYNSPLDTTLCLASTVQRPSEQNCRKITVNRPSINGAFHWITAHQRNRQMHPKKKVSVGW